MLTQTGAETGATFAAAFAAAPRILCACSGGTVGFARSTGVTPSGVDVSAYNTSAARIAGYVAIIAIGRWF
ncbi:hypothetical protein SAMN04488103_107182 [Gemmobacter aquatilis]|uniref:Uncharacterized protein n=1 Tax=Gemmobacter aquatilis TaxID=933059 RepID=A0A1H8JAD4_9RHOB|nr:hypothetical protein [Gemmobacter aquatilis]SEN77157.1 hypothetical protein SAMN04488103_107182 [Gemmobacter aquatilis]